MSDFMCFSWGIEVAGAYLFVGNHVFILKNKIRSWFGNNFYCYRRFRFDPRRESTFTAHSTQLNAGLTPRTLPLPALFPFSSVPLLTLCRCCFFLFFFFLPSWFQHPFTTVFFFFFFFRVASLFIDNNNVHFTVWFWNAGEGREWEGPGGSPLPPPGVPVVSLCKWCSWHSCLWNNYKEVSAYSRCRKSVSSAFITYFFFFVPKI